MGCIRINFICFGSFDIPKSYIFAVINLLFYLNISSKEIRNIFAVRFSTHICLMCLYDKKRLTYSIVSVDKLMWLWGFFPSLTGVASYQPQGTLRSIWYVIIRSCEVSNPRDLCQQSHMHYESWQASRHHAAQTHVKVISSYLNTGYHTNVPSYTEMEINVISMKFLSLDAPEVVTMTTSSAGSEENFVKMTFLFKCIPPSAGPTVGVSIERILNSNALYQ